MSTKLGAFLIGLALLAAGCGAGEPRLDASTQERLDQSMKAVTAGMTVDQRKQFAADVMAAAGPDMIREGLRVGREGGEPDRATLFKGIHGLTVAEIQAKAEANRKAPPKLAE